MRNSKINRWVFFFLGLTVGVVLSVVVYGYFINSQRYILSATKNTETTEIAKTVKEKPVVKPKTKVKKHKSVPKMKLIIKDSIPPVNPIDSLVQDSLKIDSITPIDTVDNQIDPADIVVVKDELIYSKQIIPLGDAKGFLCDNTSELDSLLVDNITKISQKGIRVEFWKSPVNFKGYKLNKRQLILFGIMEFDAVTLEFQEGKALLLHYRNQDFELKCTQEFLPLNIQK